MYTDFDNSIDYEEQEYNPKQNKGFFKYILIFLCLFLIGGGSYFLFFNQETDQEEPNEPSNPPAEKEIAINLVDDNINIINGNKISLSIETIGIDQKMIIWSSSNANIASVTSGTIEALSVGTSIITASYTENGVVYKDSCTINVTKEENVSSKDTISPSITYNMVGGSNNKWTNKEVTVTIKATDNKKVKEITYTIDCHEACEYKKIKSGESIKFSKNGITSLFIKAEDTSGNIKTVNLTIKIDKTSPLVEYSTYEGSYKTIPNLVIKAVDNESGIDHMDILVYKNEILDEIKTVTNYKNTNYNVLLDSNGKWQVVTKIYDMAGNISYRTPNIGKGYSQYYYVTLK